MTLKIFCALNVMIWMIMIIYDMDKMHNVGISNKKKTWPLFQINPCSLNKNFEDLQYLLSCTKIILTGVSETRVTKQLSLLNNLNLNNYSYEFTPTETTAGGTLLYIANHLSYKCCNDLNTYKKMNWNQLFLKLSNQKNQILLRE